MQTARTDLGSYAPVEPPYVRGVSEHGVDPVGDQHVALGLLVLHNVVEVGAGGQHGGLAEALPTHHHQQAQQAEVAQLLQLWNSRETQTRSQHSLIRSIKRRCSKSFEHCFFFFNQGLLDGTIDSLVLIL